MMYIETQLRNINFAQTVPKIELKNFSFKLGVGTRIYKENNYEKELGDIWESKADTNEVYWSQKRDGNHLNEDGVFDDNFGEVEERNELIAKIRDKYLKQTKVGRSSYEKLGNYFYKSIESYKKFIDEVERECLVKSSVSKKTKFHSFKQWDKFEIDTEDQGDFYR